MPFTNQAIDHLMVKLKITVSFEICSESAVLPACPAKFLVSYLYYNDIELLTLFQNCDLYCFSNCCIFIVYIVFQSLLLVLTVDTVVIQATLLSSIILVTTLSSRGHALTSSGNCINHSCFYNVAQFKCHCSLLLVRELKYYVRLKKIFQFQRM